MREAFSMLEDRLGRPVRWQYEEQNRRGDHICYISDLSKLKSHYPQWSITRRLDDILDEMVEFELQRGSARSEPANDNALGGACSPMTDLVSSCPQSQ